jgi:aspartate/methionine/tyrosine aminotransferase
MPASIFGRLFARAAGFAGEVIPLHIGDTHVGPPPSARFERLGLDDAPGCALYRYGPAAGWTPLVEQLAAKLVARNRMLIEPAGVQITAGATHALACAIGAIADPGDELLVLTPHWPMICGIARARGVVPIEVPFSQRLRAGDASVDAILTAAITPRTRAIYLATPNNPDGVVLTAAELAAIVAVAVRHDLWIVADEVYEDYVYAGAHVSIGSLPGAAERTIAVYSFSKGFAQAGLRIGYAAGPVAAIAAMRALVNHSIYNVPHAVQRAAVAALAVGDDFLAGARDRALAARDRAIAAIAAPCATPAGATYLFLDLRAWDRGDPDGLLERIAGAGVILGPGRGFGAAYHGWARLCFTAVDEARLAIGIARINAVLAG